MPALTKQMYESIPPEEWRRMVESFDHTRQTFPTHWFLQEVRGEKKWFYVHRWWWQRAWFDAKRWWRRRVLKEPVPITLGYFGIDWAVLEWPETRIDSSLWTGRGPQWN